MIMRLPWQLAEVNSECYSHLTGGGLLGAQDSKGEPGRAGVYSAAPFRVSASGARELSSCCRIPLPRWAGQPWFPLCLCLPLFNQILLVGADNV